MRPTASHPRGHHGGGGRRRLHRRPAAGEPHRVGVALAQVQRCDRGDLPLQAPVRHPHRAPGLQHPQRPHARPGRPAGLAGRRGTARRAGDRIRGQHRRPTSLRRRSAAGATRLRSVGVELAFRGTDPSSPTLTCPEVDDLAVQAPGLPDDDPGLRTRFLDSVAACAARLRATGVEPANFDTTAAAADVDELRKAMGIDTWSASRLLRHPVAGPVPLPARLPGPARGGMAGLALVPGDRRPDRRRTRNPLRACRTVHRLRGRRPLQPPLPRSGDSVAAGARPYGHDPADRDRQDH